MEPGHPQRHHRQGVLSTLLIVIASLFATAGAWAAGPKNYYNIPAGDAVKALHQYSLQSKIEILYVVEIVQGQKTNAIVGNYDATEALALMLKGTDLEFAFKDDSSFAYLHLRKDSQAGSAEHVAVAEASTLADSRGPTEAMREIFPEQKLEEVVITGTLIRGVQDIMSPLEVVTKREIKKTAYATVQDALQALPVNFGSGLSENVGGVGNYARGSSANLRGLGAGATLVLVNGHRQPYSGFEGDFVDLSSIAWSAVERIEVLPDGAAALYGSDAIAGVVNIIMRSDFDGAETQARLGSAAGGAEEKLISQLFGTTWSSGNALLSYQYAERTALAASERDYTANSDKRSLGGTDYRSYSSNPGNILDLRTLLPTYGIPSNQDGKSLTVGDLLPGTINLQNTYDAVDLLPNRKSHSFFFSGKQQLGDRVSLFVESRFSHRDITQDLFSANQLLLVPQTNAFYVNPYPGLPFAVVSYNFGDDLGPFALRAVTNTFSGTFGGSAQVSDSWSVKLSGSYGRDSMLYTGANQVNQDALGAALADSDRATAFNPFGDGSNTNPSTIAAIRTTQRLQSVSEIRSAGVITDGTAFNLPTGAVKLALGGELRSESLERGSTNLHQFDRSIKSAFAELAIPLVGTADDARAVPRLELSLAARYEQYSDFGNTSNPKIGLRWAPSSSVKFRTSWGTSFKAPKLSDVYDSTTDLALLTSLTDPRSPNGSSLVLGIQGSNPDLKEETASTWTAGLDFAPTSINGLSLSLTYYSIDYDDRILVPGPPTVSDILLQESQWTSVINRSPTPGEIHAVCESKVFVGSVAQCESAPVAAIVDLRVRNMAQTRVRGIDLKLDQTLRTRFGRFDMGLNGGYVFNFSQATSNTSDLRDVVNTVGNPVALRMRGSVDWYQHDWDRPGIGASATIDYLGAYRDSALSATKPVDSLATLDLRVSYRTPRGSGAFDGLEFGLNGVNVFNEAPPFVDRSTGYDQINAQPFGRVVSFTIQKDW
jgi:iron complex outermembrane receptor protein